MSSEDMQGVMIDALAVDRIVGLLEQIASENQPANPPKILSFTASVNASATGVSNIRASNQRWFVKEVIIAAEDYARVTINIGTLKYVFTAGPTTLGINFPFAIDKGIDISVTVTDLSAGANSVWVYLIAEPDDN
jgi:hypothetical protein